MADITTHPRLEASPRAEPSTRPDRWLGAGLLLLGFGAALAAALGPLWLNVIRYHASEGALIQVIGGDVAGLLLVGPVAILAGVLVLRGHTAGPVLALGPAAYALYMYAQLAVGGDVLRYPGTAERFFPLLLGLFVLGGVVALRSWATIEPAQLPVAPRWLDRALGGVFLAMAAFLVFGLHLPGLAAVWQGQPGPEYLADPLVFWVVKFMDLGIIVPVMAAVGAGLLRGRPWAHKARYGAVSWAALLGSAVAGMAVVMQITGDPAATTANTVVFTGFAAITVVVAAIVHAPLFGRRTSAG